MKDKNKVVNMSQVKSGDIVYDRDRDLCIVTLCSISDVGSQEESLQLIIIK